MSLESTPIAAICRRTGTDLDRCATATTGGLAALDDRVGVGEDATEPEVTAEGGPEPGVWPEQPAVATAKMASRVATPALTLTGVGRGPRFWLWCRKLAGFLRCSGDADVRQ